MKTVLLFTASCYSPCYLHIAQGSRVRPNFSRVRNKNPRAHWCVQPFEKRKKSIRDSETQQKTLPLGLYRGLNQSEIVKGGPPSDWPWSRYSCMCVCALTNASRVLLQSDREKEVSSRDACSVANLATFSTFVDPHSNFLFSKKSN